MTDTNSTGADRPSIPTNWREWRKARKPHEAKLAARRARDRVRWYAVIQPALIKAARAALDAVYHSPKICRTTRPLPSASSKHA
jgi:hypothetical protein